MTKEIRENCESLINLANSSDSEVSMLIVKDDYPEYKNFLEEKGYKVGIYEFGEMATVSVSKV